MGSAPAIIGRARIVMAGEFQNELKEELSGLDTAGLRRTLRIVSGPQQTRIQLDGSDVLHFSSNDYLGLANHPSLKTCLLYTSPSPRDRG